MDLKEFIEETVKQIIDGVVEAQKHGKLTGVTISSFGKPREVVFDVSVTVVEDQESKGKAGLRVWSIGADITSTKNTVNTLAHRIQFSVPIFFDEIR